MTCSVLRLFSSCIHDQTFNEEDESFSEEELMKIRRETKFHRKLSKIYIFPDFLPVCTVVQILFEKHIFQKLRLNVTNSRQQILELTSLVDRDQKQLAIIEFLILVEEQSIN